ncbi:hypothetical protein SAMN05444673_0986 [Bacillus sp. OV166]|nr:hypothetical protein SAMN05444673_0986 [Bacillus sp. OV166]
MEKLLWPWQSKVINDYPWVFYIFLISLSIILSIITWVRNYTPITKTQ